MNGTKQCDCGNIQLVLIRSQNIKMYGDCAKTIPWGLDKGQKALK